MDGCQPIHFFHWVKTIRLILAFQPFLQVLKIYKQIFMRFREQIYLRWRVRLSRIIIIIMQLKFTLHLQFSCVDLLVHSKQNKLHCKIKLTRIQSFLSSCFKNSKRSNSDLCMLLIFICSKRIHKHVLVLNLLNYGFSM